MLISMSELNVVANQLFLLFQDAEFGSHGLLSEAGRGKVRVLVILILEKI